ncbi:MAG TPA: hypothetical protein VHY91_02110 [Pirellulales bacterium]|jgi:hypothetical protein|nr:hypothetical protein [Pirellulales bacterium]
MPVTPIDYRNDTGGRSRIRRIRIGSCALALVTLLVPTCLLGQDRKSSREAEVMMKLRNEVEENWIRQYKSISPSESARSARESTQTAMGGKEAPMSWRKKGKSSREKK